MFGILSLTWLPFLVRYSGDLKFDHSKSGIIWYLAILKIGFQMVLFSKGHNKAIAMVPTIQKSDHSKSTFLPNGFLFAKNHLKSRFKCQDVMLWLRLKTWSFENRTIWIQSLKTPDFKYFQISNALFSVPHYIWNPTEAQIARLFELFSRIF